MKNEFTSSKDNSALAAVMSAILFATVCTFFISNHASAHQPDVVAQKMDTIVVTGKQSADVTLDTIVVTASRGDKAQG